MAQSIKLDDDLYSLLKDLADSECRTVPLEIRFLVQYYKNGVVEEKKEVKPSQGTVVTKSYAELKAEKTKIIGEYNEKMNYCQDYGERSRLQHELDDKLRPINNQIDEMFRK